MFSLALATATDHFPSAIGKAQFIEIANDYA
jgi:hypothetical protein